MKETIAKVVSGIFLPHLTLFYFVIAYLIIWPPKNLFIALAIIMTLYYLPGLIALFILMKKLNKTVDMMSGRERLPSIIVGVICYIISLLIFIYLKDVNMAILTFFLTVFTIIFGAFSAVDKPSFHTGAFTGAVVYLSLKFSPALFSLLLLVPLIAWSRILLKAHTLKQTILGSILGATTAIIAFIFSLYIYAII